MLIEANLVVQRLRSFVESEPNLGHSIKSGARASGRDYSSAARSSRGAGSLTRVGTGPKGQLVFKRAAEKEREYWQRLTKVSSLRLKQKIWHVFVSRHYASEIFTGILLRGPSVSLGCICGLIMGFHVMRR
jgi:hypothetical protein